MHREPCSVTKLSFDHCSSSVISHMWFTWFCSGNSICAPQHTLGDPRSQYILKALIKCAPVKPLQLYLSISKPYLTAEAFSALTFHDSPRALQVRKWNGCLWETAVSEWRSLLWEVISQHIFVSWITLDGVSGKILPQHFQWTPFSHHHRKTNIRY